MCIVLQPVEVTNSPDTIRNIPPSVTHFKELTEEPATETFAFCLDESIPHIYTLFP
jgi:hypothetical protein